MTPLFTDLSIEDSSAIIKELDRQAIPYEMRNDGAIIMVPKDRVTRLRMKFAEGGLPKGGGVGYEIFDKSDSARHHQLRPEHQSSARARGRALPHHPGDRPGAGRARPPGAAGAAAVLARQGRARRPRSCSRCAARSKPRRCARSATSSPRRSTASSPQRVSIVDEAGRLLADGAADDSAGGGTSADERQVAYERRLREQIENIVSSVVGPGRARVQLTADFDFNRITQTSDKFDPDGRVVRSTQTREESSGTTDNQGQVTVGNELPGTQNRSRTAPRASRARSPRKSSITTSRARPRPR